MWPFSSLDVFPSFSLPHQERFKALQAEAAENEKRLRSNRVLSSRENAHDLGGHTEEEGGRYRNFPSVLTSKMKVFLTSVVSLDHFYAIDAVEYKKDPAAAANPANAKSPLAAEPEENSEFDSELCDTKRIVPMALSHKS